MRWLVPISSVAVTGWASEAGDSALFTQVGDWQVDVWKQGRLLGSVVVEVGKT